MMVLNFFLLTLTLTVISQSNVIHNAVVIKTTQKLTTTGTLFIKNSKIRIDPQRTIKASCKFKQNHDILQFI